MQKKNSILLATRNLGKIAEFSSLLKPFALDVLGLQDFPYISEIEETGSTFAENALLKASHACQASGLITLADDSGLMVNVLGGAPGVFSARFSASPEHPATDQSNIQKLLELLKPVPEGRRQAAFCCVIAAVAPNGAKITADGLWAGSIAPAPAGNNGFGYDPVFFDPDLGKTAAQLDPDEKNSRSHRARALQKLQAIWPEFWLQAQ